MENILNKYSSGQNEWRCHTKLFKCASSLPSHTFFKYHGKKSIKVNLNEEEKLICREIKDSFDMEPEDIGNIIVIIGPPEEPNRKIKNLNGDPVVHIVKWCGYEKYGFVYNRICDTWCSEKFAELGLIITASNFHLYNVHQTEFIDQYIRQTFIGETQKDQIIIFSTPYVLKSVGVVKGHNLFWESIWDNNEKPVLKVEHCDHTKSGFPRIEYLRDGSIPLSKVVDVFGFRHLTSTFNAVQDKWLNLENKLFRLFYDDRIKSFKQGIIYKCKCKCNEHNWKLATPISIDVEGIEEGLIHIICDYFYKEQQQVEQIKSNNGIVTRLKCSKECFLGFLHTSSIRNYPTNGPEFYFISTLDDMMIHMYHNSKSKLLRFRVTFQVKFKNSEGKIQSCL